MRRVLWRISFGGPIIRRSAAAQVPCGRKRRGCRKLVFSLPRRPDRSTHRVQERVDVLAAERRRRVAKHALAVVPVHGPAARLGCGREGLAIHDGVGDGLRAIVGDPLLDRRRKLGARADRDARNRHGHRRGQRLEARRARRARRTLARARRAPRRPRAKAPALPGCSGNGPPPTTLRGDAGASADRDR